MTRIFTILYIISWLLTKRYACSLLQLGKDQRVKTGQMSWVVDISTLNTNSVALTIRRRYAQRFFQLHKVRVKREKNWKYLIVSFKIAQMLSLRSTLQNRIVLFYSIEHWRICYHSMPDVFFTSHKCLISPIYILSSNPYDVRKFKIVI